MEKSNRKLHLLGDEKKLRDLSENKFRKKQKNRKFCFQSSKKAQKNNNFSQLSFKTKEVLYLLLTKTRTVTYSPLPNCMGRVWF